MLLVVQYHFSACVILSLPTGVHFLSMTSFLCGCHPFFVDEILQWLTFSSVTISKRQTSFFGHFFQSYTATILNRQITTRRVGRESAGLVWKSGTQETTWYLDTETAISSISNKVWHTGRQLPPLFSVLYGIISRRRSVLATKLLLREKSGA